MNYRLGSPISLEHGSENSSFKERVLFRNGKYVRVQTEQRNGLVFMRAKQRVIYRNDDYKTGEN